MRKPQFITLLLACLALGLSAGRANAQEPQKFAVTFPTVEAANGTLVVSDAEGAMTTGKEVAANTEITVVATPAEGKQIKSFTIANAAVENAAGSKVAMSKKHTVTAATAIAVEFETAKHKITYTAPDGAEGSLEVTSASTPVNNEGTVDHNAKITVKVTPAAGKQIKSLTIAGEAVADAVGKKEAYTAPEHTVVKDTEIAVVFENAAPAPAEFDITLKVEEEANAQVTLTKNGTPFTAPGKAVKDDKLEVTVTPNEGFEVKEVTFAGGTAIAAVEGKYPITIVDKGGEIKVVLQAKGTPAKHVVTITATPEGAGMVAVTYGLTVVTSGNAVAEGTELTVNVTAKAGKQIKSVTIAGEAQAEAVGKDKFTKKHTVTAATTIAVEFEDKAAGNEFAVTFVAPAATDGTLVVKEGERTLATGDKVAENATITVTVTPATGKQIKSLKIAGEAKADAAGKTVAYTATHQVVAATAIEVEFEDKAAGNEFAVTFVAPAATDGTLVVKEGEKTLATGDKVAENATITVTVTPATGKQIKSLKIAGEAKADAAGKTTAYMATHQVVAATAIEVEFEDAAAPAGPFAVTIAFDAQQGEVSVMKGTQVFNSGETVNAGEKLQVVAKPKDGFELDKITFDGVATPADGDGNYFITVEKAGEIKVTFKVKAAEEFEVTIAAAENGKVVVKNGAADFTGGKLAKGTKLEVTATPNEGFELDAITFAGVKVDPNAEAKYIITVEKAGEIKVTFKAKTPAPQPEMVKVSIAKPTNGTVMVVKMKDKTEFKGGDVAKGTMLAMKATPNKGYEIDKATFAGAPIKLDAKGMGAFKVEKDGELKVTFKKSKTTPVESLLFAGVSVQPNPFATAFQVSGVAEASRISVLTLTGSVVRTIAMTGEENVTIDLSDLHAGVYMVLVERGAERKLVRVVKQ